MDKTPEYIKMCERAEEVQEQWEPKAGDFVFNPKLSDVGVVVYREEVKKDKEIWLPRQDQLQEMVLPMWTDKTLSYRVSALLGQFTNWFMHNDLTEFTTIEQFWLGFVMKKKFKKVWNGEDWVSA